MSAAHVIEVSATSDKSFEDAVQRGISRVSATRYKVKSAWVKEQQVDVENGKIRCYRVHLLITFVLEDVPESRQTTTG